MESDEEDMAAARSPRPRVPGTIVRVSVRDFMQYTESSFRPGPNLNVILGPNGAGKSSLVLAIALGLAGKPNMLGRAAHLGEYVRLGAERAEVEVELVGRRGQDGPNVVVSRSFGKDGEDSVITLLQMLFIVALFRSTGKSTWRLDGRVAAQKVVERLMAELRIQVGNLCQFLPQDKVHQFSKMNPKELLAKTVEAVGEPELVEDQERQV